MKKIATLALIITIASCTASKMTVPSQANAAQQSFPGATVADLKSGMALYEANCGLCHKLHAPADFEVNAWHNIVPDMVQKVNQNQMKLNENDERLILMYVTTMR